MGPGFRFATADDKTAHASNAATEFVNFPGLPTCIKGSVKNGDPTRGEAVIFTKSTTGCKLPWHWHTANEQLMMVSGSGKVDMKDAKPAMLHASSFVSLPGKNTHEFSCVAACTFFIVTDGAFDIHYVDKDGKEISRQEALKSKGKTPMKKESKDMKDMKM